MFSIIIPTWNNLPYVKLCVESIRKNSTLPCQIILHINDGSDGTLAWAKEQQLQYTHTPENVGICIAVNMAGELAVNDNIVYMNDDMYACPDWDKYLAEEINNLSTDNFMLSSTMIEPRDSGNGAVIVADFGRDVESFREQDLLNALPTFHKADWNGSSWPPVVISKKYWNIIGGFSIEFSPGMASDDDYAKKMWAAGCRYFKGVGKSMVYHFQTKSTLRIKKNNGRKQFLLKWDCSSSIFNKHYILKGQPFAGFLKEPSADIIKKDKLKTWFKKKFVY
ncbi:MAG TPA: glycosyltransferase [Ferruginibacter sp.]|jgi:glycosyltransferase involved in cell wall biosynthesis|nr:glycosyltransferase [Ferruginibacter sp.]